MSEEALIQMATIDGSASQYTSIWQSFSKKGCIVLDKFTKHELFLNVLAVSYKSGAYKIRLEKL